MDRRLLILVAIIAALVLYDGLDASAPVDDLAPAEIAEQHVAEHAMACDSVERRHECETP